jgi:hypothetical protein
MKNVIIRINDISDIDTAKISVYDLNNRYVDMHGNMYGLKFNKALKRMEVIKIVRTHEKNAGSFQQKIIIKKRGMGETAANNHAQQAGITPDRSEAAEIFFNPDVFIEKSMESARVHKDRVKGIIMNIRNSNIIPKENKMESNQLEDIFRNLDIDVIQGVENLTNYQKEMINYPRSITYYQAKYDERGREIIESLSSSNKKVIRFIYLSEMLENIRTLYRNMDRIIKILKVFLEAVNIEEIRWINPYERQSFKDGMVSINTTLQEISSLQDDLKQLEDYTYNLDHYA